MIQSKKDLKYYLTADSARYNNQIPNILDLMNVRMLPINKFDV